MLANTGEYYCSPTVGAEQAQDAARERSVDEVEEGGPPGSTPVRLRRAEGWTGAGSGDWEGELELALKAGGSRTLYLLVRSDGRASVHATRDAGQPLATLEQGRWSPFAAQSLISS